MKSERRKVLIFAVLLVILAFISVGCISATTIYANPDEAPHASFSVRGTMNVLSNNDTITTGPQLVRYEYGMSVYNTNDTSDTVLGNLEYILRADNIVDVDYEEYADWNNSYVKWVFSSNYSLTEDDWLYTSAKTSFFETKYIPMSMSRRMNKTIFDSDDYQLAEFNVSFDEINFDSCCGIIIAEENSLVNASFVLDTLSVDKPFELDYKILGEHYIEFYVCDVSQLKANKTYNFSVVVRVDLKGNNPSPILYKPEYGILFGPHRRLYPDYIGSNVTIPSEALPEHIHYAYASTNVSNTWYIPRRPHTTTSCELDEISEPITPKIRIGYQPSTHQLAHMTAMEKGWWEEDLKIFGIEKVTDQEFPSGPPEMQAMLNGEIDIAYVGVAPFISAIDNGLDAKIVAGVQTNGSHLVLRPEINYASPGDLIGLKIATFPLCSVMDIVLKKWLVDNGLDPENDLEIIPMGPKDAIKAIKNGSVDGAFLPHPAPAIIELNGSGGMVVASGEMWPNHACCCLVVSGKLIREHPDMVKQIIKTHIKATEYNINHQDEAAEIYVNKTGANITVVNKSLNTWDGAWISNPYIGLNSTLEYAEIMYGLECVNKSLTKEDLFDLSFYEEMAVFDTGRGTYPSIMGTHEGKIIPSRKISVSRLYTYPCVGTGGHTESIELYENGAPIANGTWNGYKGDWHNITIHNLTGEAPYVTLQKDHEYNYTIRTGSYPQIIHEHEYKNATGGTITCTKFTDANGRTYDNWIPAIRLE